MDSGYSETTFDGFVSSSMKASIASSYFPFLNSETAYNDRIVVRRWAYGSQQGTYRSEHPDYLIRNNSDIESIK